MWSLRHSEAFQGYCWVHAISTFRTSLVCVHDTLLQHQQMWPLGNLPNIPTGSVYGRSLGQQVGCSKGGFPSTPPKLVSQWREVSPTLQCCPAERPQKPSIPHSACVCVYGLKNNTAWTVSFTQSNGTKCLSELAFGTTRYNPVKCFTARQCSLLARSLETGIKKSVLHFQERCQEQSLYSRLGWAGHVCVADGVVGFYPQARHWLLAPFRRADSQAWLGGHQSAPQIPLPRLGVEQAQHEAKTSQVKVVATVFSANGTTLYCRCPDSIILIISSTHSWISMAERWVIHTCSRNIAEFETRPFTCNLCCELCICRSASESSRCPKASPSDTMHLCLLPWHLEPSRLPVLIWHSRVYTCWTHVCTHPLAPLLFGGHSQLMTKFLLLSVTSVSTGEGS